MLLVLCSKYVSGLFYVQRKEVLCFACTVVFASRARDIDVHFVHRILRLEISRHRYAFLAY